MANRGEILSPAGNMAMLTAAVRSGANAVYLGAKEFSARRNAENFSIDELEEAVKYCHIRGVKVYLALNILIKDSEMESAFNLAQKAYNLGVDGIIVQDLGLASILHRYIPDLDLHASTQMSIHSPAALPLLKDMGFKQVVAAREMSKEELKVFCKMAKELEITVEVFVHGALCMCVSGQCQLSAVLGGRSGNRGLCAGPCRLPFEVEGGTGYDLSLKDLSLLDYMQELREMGVGSFKIEGRMKRPEYVAAATSACRQALDSGIVETDLAETLKNVFSRSGFTAGYYENRLGKNMFGIRTKEDVVAADKAFPRLHELYRGERQSVKISVNAEILRNKPISLTLCDGENTVTAYGEMPQEAQNKAATAEDVLKNLTKFGGTPYIDEGDAVRLDEGLFVSAGALNALRRNAVELLDNARSEIKHQENKVEFSGFSLPKEKPQKKQKTFARFADETQIPQDVSGVDLIVLPVEADFSKNYGVTYAAEMPRYIVNETALIKRAEELRAKGIEYAYCENLSALQIAKDVGFKVVAGAGLNVANSHSAKVLKDLGVEDILISVEQTLADIEDIDNSINKGIAVYGKLPLMLLRNCPMKNGGGCEKCKKQGKITDRMGIEFDLKCRMGYTELLNSKPLWLMDKKRDFAFADFVLLYFTTETKEQINEVFDGFEKSLSCGGEYTRGMYYRGTL